MRAKRKNGKPTFKELMHKQMQKDSRRDAKNRSKEKEYHYNGEMK